MLQEIRHKKRGQVAAGEHGFTFVAIWGTQLLLRISAGIVSRGEAGSQVWNNVSREPTAFGEPLDLHLFTLSQPFKTHKLQTEYTVLKYK